MGYVFAVCTTHEGIHCQAQHHLFLQLKLSMYPTATSSLKPNVFWNHFDFRGLGVPHRLATWATDDIVGSHSITCDRHWVESEECHLTIDHRTESLNPDRGTIWNNSCWFKWGTPKIEWFIILFPPKMTILIKWFIIIFPQNYNFDKMVYHHFPSKDGLSSFSLHSFPPKITILTKPQPGNCLQDGIQWISWWNQLVSIRRRLSQLWMWIKTCHKNR